MVIKKWRRALTAAVVVLALGAPLTASAQLAEYERIVNGDFDSGARRPVVGGREHAAAR